MKFHTLTAQNFLGIKSATIALDDRGLHLIQGVNTDDSSTVSNGAGKSSLPDAVMWVLRGVTARGYKGDKVVNRTAKKDCAVALTISQGESRYTVTRYRKHKTGKNSLTIETVVGGKIVELHKGTEAESQKVLDKILGCSHEVFMASVYFAQEMMPDLPMMTDRPLKMLIEEAAGLSRIERAYEIATKRRTTAQNELTAIVTRGMSAKESVQRLTTALEAMTEKVSAWESGRAGRIAEAEAVVTEATAKLRDGGKALLIAKPAYEAGLVRVKEIDEQLASHASVVAKARGAESELAAAQRQVDTVQMKLDEARRQKTKLKQQWDDAHAGKVAACAACGRTHTADERETLLTHLDKLLVTAAGVEKDLVALHGDATGALALVKSKAEKLRAEVPDVSAVTAERAALIDAGGRYTRGLDVLKSFKRNVESAQANVDRIKTEANPHTSGHQTLTEQLQAAEALAASIKAQALEKEAEVAVANSVASVFGPAGVRAEILDTVTPYLNERTADYLSVLSDGNCQAVWTTLSRSAAGELKEKFSIEVTNTTGADSFLGLSGGEKRKVRLATGLALQDLQASRAAQPIDLWMGDEIDDALDAAGLERLMVILERKARERGTVLVISHNELRDWCDNVTTVTKRAGYSTVEGSLCA